MSKHTGSAVEITGKKEIRKLLEKLDVHAAKWRIIGTNLGFDSGDLDQIQAEKSDSKARLDELLNK